MLLVMQSIKSNLYTGKILILQLFYVAEHARLNLTQSQSPEDWFSCVEVSKGAKIRNQYNQVPHLTQDTNGK